MLLSEAVSVGNEFRWDSEFFLKSYLDNEKLLNKWKTKPLSSYADFIKKGIFDLPPSNYMDTGVPLIRTSEIKKPNIDFGTTVFLTEKTNSDNYKTILNPQDIVFTKIGTYIGDVARLPKTYRSYNFSQNVAGVKINNKAESAYLLSYLLSSSGQKQILRSAMLSAQGKLELNDIRNYKIPCVSIVLQKAIDDIFSQLEKTEEQSKTTYTAAENILLSEIGLTDFTPSNEPVNIKTFSESFATSGRLDAEYYQRKYEDLFSAINQYKRWDYLENITTYISNGNQPPYSENGTIRFFSQKWIGDKSIDYGFLKETEEPMVEATFFEEPKNTPSLVGYGDILYYSVGANLGYCHNYLAEEKIAVGSFINIIRADRAKINDIYLGIALNSIIGRMQGDKEKSGIAQPYIYAKSLRKFKIPIASPAKQSEIAALITQSFNLKKQSEHLLEVAKRAVEIAIEQDEAAAMAWIAAHALPA